MDAWMDGMMDGWNDGWMDGWNDGWMDGWNDGWMDGWMLQFNKAPLNFLPMSYYLLFSFREACDSRGTKRHGGPGELGCHSPVPGIRRPRTSHHLEED